MPRPTFTASSPRSARPLRAGRLLASAVAIAVVVLAPSRAPATGGEGGEDGDSSFFSPEVIGNPREVPFFRSRHALYQQTDGDGAAPPSEALEVVNTQEWSAYFGGKVAVPNLNFLIYKMKLGELDKLIWTLEGKSPALSREAAAVKAELDAVGNKAQVLKALYYLGFAKRCEPIASRRLGEDAWDAQKLSAASAHDGETAAKLLAASEPQLASVQDKFLAERYRFQRLRLMFYTGRYADAQKYYAENLAAFTTESSVKYRFMDVAAGSFYHAKQFGPANYIYSLIFDHFAPLKRSAYLSFHPVEDADWKKCLSLAKNEREKTVIWQLLGIYADGAAAIDKIYALAPASNLLPLLLVREVNKAEEDWSTNDRRRRDGATDVKADEDTVGKQRLALIKRIADEKKAFKPYLWQLALGHLYALSGDSKSSLARLELAEKTMPKDPALGAQVRLSRLFAKVRGVKAIDKTLEPYLAGELKWLKTQTSANPRAGELTDWTLGTLSRVYKAGGDVTRALLLVDTAEADLYRDNRRIDAIAEFQTRPGKSAFDEFLAGNYGYSKGQLLELKALNELYAGRFKSAVELFALAGPEIGNQPLAADPFIIHNVDCHDCDFAAKTTVHYTKASFASQVLELSVQAERKGSEGAQASFKLANALYNMTYYGNARAVYRTQHYNFPDTSALNLNMNLAEKYYKRAMELTGDKEFKAKACFMAAKTEQNRYFNTLAENPARPADRLEPVHSPVYFKMLKDSYANTRYYREIIRECGYFRGYLQR